MILLVACVPHHVLNSKSMVESSVTVPARQRILFLLLPCRQIPHPVLHLLLYMLPMIEFQPALSVVLIHMLMVNRAGFERLGKSRRADAV